MLHKRVLLVSPERLRFDFSHPQAMHENELQQVEAIVNSRIRANSEVATRIMTPDEATAEGALALFGEKYGDEVRVVSMGGAAAKGQEKLPGRLNYVAAPMCSKQAILRC